MAHQVEPLDASKITCGPITHQMFKVGDIVYYIADDKFYDKLVISSC